MDQFGLQFLQPCLGLLLLGKVADEACKVGFSTRLHLADGEMHRKRGAVLAHAGHDATDADNASFTGLQVAGEVAVMAAAIRLRHQLADVLSDRLGLGVAELTLGGAREKLHDAMLVDHDHRIRDRIQDRAKMPLADPDGVLEALLMVDIDHDAAEPRRDATGSVDDGAECAHPMTLLRPGQPVLNVEIAAGADRLLQGCCRAFAIAVDPAKPGKVRSRRAYRARRRKALGWCWTSPASGLKNPDPRCRRLTARPRCAHFRRADPDSGTVGRRQSCFAFESLLPCQIMRPIERAKGGGTKLLLASTALK